MSDEQVQETKAKQRYAVVGINKVQEHPKNPRIGDVAKIEKSIKANDFYGAVVVQKSTGYILAGNHRWKAAQKTGLKRIPVIYLDIDDEAATRVLLADNRTSDKSKYDQDALLAILRDTAEHETGLEGTGYTDGDLARLAASLDVPVDIDKAPVPSHDERSKIVHKCPNCHYEWQSG